MLGMCKSVPKAATAETVPAKPAEPEVARTSKSAFVPAAQALQLLKEGNARYVKGETPRATTQSLRQALSDDGQLPMAAVLGCADSRCPVELMFDVMPGDVFICRNAGNSIAQAEGSVVASMEYCVGHLQTKLLVVLGHTKCGAWKGAVASLPAEGAAPAEPDPANVLGGYLGAGLGPVALEAKKQMPAGTSVDEVAVHAIKVNVTMTVSKMLEISAPLREKVDAGELTVLGAIYDITTGRVEFLEQPAICGTCTKKQPADAKAPEKLTGA
jgi:carbonic anhydrase